MSTHDQAGLRPWSMRRWLPALLTAAGCLLGTAVAHAEFLRLARCGSEQVLVQIRKDGRVLGGGGPNRILSTNELAELLALVQEGTAGMSQQWVNAAADSHAAGQTFTDRPCVNLRLGPTLGGQQIQWSLVPEPWDLASLKLHRLEQTIFGLTESG